jgi:hypothetical protein
MPIGMPIGMPSLTCENRLASKSPSVFETGRQIASNGDILTAKMAAPMEDYESFSDLETNPFKDLVLGNGVDSATTNGRELALEHWKSPCWYMQTTKRITCS